MSTLSTLSNIQNSIFVPYLPSLYSRTPTADTRRSRAMTRARASTVGEAGRGSRRGSVTGPSEGGAPGRARASTISGTRSRQGSIATTSGRDTPSSTGQAAGAAAPLPPPARRPSILRKISSALGVKDPQQQLREEQARAEEEEKKREEQEKLAREHVPEWMEMTEEEREELDEHVRYLLTKKQKFKRIARGFWKFVKTPMGFIMTLYGILITFWGTAIVLFLLRWIDAGNPARQRYWIEICDQILCALFTAVGLGFAPFRAVDTYRMIWIAHYHHLTWRRRKENKLPKLADPSDLPRPTGQNRVRRAMAYGGNIFRRKVNVSSPVGSVVGSRRGCSSSSRRASVEQDRNPIDLDRRQTKQGDLEAQLPPPGDLDPTTVTEVEISDVGSVVPKDEDVVVLSPEEQVHLIHHQKKFHQSHTFYRPHETETHYVSLITIGHRIRPSLSHKARCR
jgi:hypothetical protein